MGHFHPIAIIENARSAWRFWYGCSSHKEAVNLGGIWELCDAFGSQVGFSPVVVAVYCRGTCGEGHGTYAHTLIISRRAKRGRLIIGFPPFLPVRRGVAPASSPWSVKYGKGAGKRWPDTGAAPTGEINQLRL